MNTVAGFPAHSPRRGRYSRQEREAIVEQVRRLRSDGMAMSGVVAEVGVSQMTLAKWLRESNPAPAFLPVVVGSASSASAALALVTPSGYRIEGLTMDALLALLGRLG